ncbi:transcriptional regulator, TetR family [Actinomadura meyerae]|uniref:Transcriptional regulator, TetR family n=1 Tax=Actinomadura meyerae TaxID=240840 RepID=A0A239P3H6_9ACTN|nr:TetR/AcrR family transcriptional regulator [Actinomadura meyerae]SNT61158.1 transcriptional regulator, TetR family [Actinomadura meyerae]
MESTGGLREHKGELREGEPRESGRPGAAGGRPGPAAGWPEPRGGLRERKKEATRRALHEAAMRLSVEHGLDEVTVEAIADAAGVSRRTFSNYFGGKEEALLYSGEQRMRALLEIFPTRPEDESSWTALQATWRLVHERFGDLDPQWAAQVRLARNHPSVLARQLAHYAEFERALTELIAERDGVPSAGLRHRVMAGAFMTALRIASVIWTEERSTRSLAEVVEETLAEISREYR